MGGLTGETNESMVDFGELLWVKLHEASWWPAQVVDENLVCSANKPSSKGSSSDVLVRLYGCYIYKYVDIHSSRAEFKSVLTKSNFNYHGILKMSLEQDLPSLSSSKSRKRQQSKSKGKVVTEASQNKSSDKSQTKASSKKQKQERLKTPEKKTKNTNTEPCSPNTATMRPQEFSARRVKVMQSLGLVAPSGSPFPRNQVISGNPTVLN